MGKKPHIIIFNPDEMRADTMAHLGNPAAVTPVLDRFAAEEGVSFSRAYCQNPVCVPSRCSFFTGLYPHTRGHRTMSYLLRPGEETLFSELRKAGYYVWMNTRNDLLAGQYPGWAESHADEIHYGGLESAPPGPVDPDVRGELGGKYYYSHFRGQLGLDGNGRNYTGDDDTVDAAIRRIESIGEIPDGKPLCMFLGLIYPHVPYSVEEPYFSAIDRSKLPPRIGFDECSGKAKIIEKIHEYCAMDGLTEAEWDEIRAVYLGMCMKVDRQFGRLVDALKKAGIYDDCAIFFLSDHGDFAGDYGLPEKAQNSFEDCLTRVPFLVKPPKGVDFTPGVSDSLVELVDFYATALDFAGVESSHTQFGRSVRETLKDHHKPVRDFVCCEGGRIPGETHCDEYHSFLNGAPKSMDYWPKIYAQVDDDTHSKGIMLRDERYKYVSRVSGADELYDMVNDPGERKNIIHEPGMESVVASMEHRMLKWLEETSDIVPYDYDFRFTPDMAIASMRSNIHPDDVDAVRQMIIDGVPAFQAVSIARQRREAGEV